MHLVLIIDASRGKVRNVNTAKEAAINYIGCSDDVGTRRLVLVIFTPVDIRRAASTSRVDDMAGLNIV